MPRPKLSLALASCLLAATALLATASPPQQDSLPAMKEQLAKLKAQVAELEAKIAAAEAPAAGTVPPIVAALNALPKNLWPGDNDTPIKENLRDKWLAENIKPGTTYEFTGSVFLSSPTTINEQNKPPVDAVNVILDCGKHTIWGVQKEVKVLAVLSNVKPADALDWSDKTTITLTGKSNSVGPSGSTVDVRMDTSTKK